MLSKKTLKPRENAGTPLFDKAALALLFLLLLTDVLDGAIRYWALQLHLLWLPYLPRFLMALVLGPMLLVRVAGEGLNFMYVALLSLFTLAAIQGVFNLGNTGQVEFGLWVLLPFLYGVVVAESIIRNWKKLIPYAVLLWVLAEAGVCINYFHSWPWAGLDYQLGATEVNAGHLWQTGGIQIDRLTGFTRSWFEAAIQILFLAIFLRSALRKHWWIPVWILSGGAIVLTTTKTTIVAFLLFSALWVFWRRGISKPWGALLIMLVCLDVVLPLSLFFTQEYRLGEDRSPAVHLVVASLIARVQQEWPEALSMIATRGGPILGRGMGGIGSAQSFFEPAIQNGGENVALFLYGYFGLLGVVFLLAYAWKASRMSRNGRIGEFVFCCACVVLLEGAAMSVLEASLFLSLAFGVSLWYAQKMAGAYSYVFPHRRRNVISAVESRFLSPEQPDGAA